jgi:hypothetical protein
MNDKNLMRALRAVDALDVQNAPKQHHLRTPQCPPLARFPAGVREGWKPEEREHVTGCAYCQRVTALEWRAECPGPFTLALYLEGICPDREALEFHLQKDRCPRCQRLLRSLLLRELAAPLRAGRPGVERARPPLECVAAGFAPLPALGEFGPATRPPFQLRAVLPDGSLAVTVRETDVGELVAHVRAPDPAKAGRTVRVEVLGAGEALTADVVLEGQGESGCSGRHTFGPFAELAPRLGADCAVLAALIETSPGHRREERGTPDTVFSMRGVRVKLLLQDASLSVTRTGRFLPGDDDSQVA